MKVKGFYKRDGKTHPITENKSKSQYTGQTTDSTWKQSSIQDIKKEQAEHPWASKMEAIKIARDHARLERYKEGTVLVRQSDKKEFKIINRKQVVISNRPEIQYELQLVGISGAGSSYHSDINGLERDYDVKK